MRTRSVVIALLVGMCLTSCSPSPSYLSFINRDQAYYEKIADACTEMFRANAPTGIVKVDQNSNGNTLLPKALQDLHPNHFRIKTNGVSIVIGVGRGAYGIGWQPQNTDSNTWELRTYAEGIEKVLFTKYLNSTRTR